jgi:predicted esterase
MVCASADYRLRPHVGYDEQLADALAAIEWVRSHAQDYGGDPDRTFLVGSSAGAYLSVDAVNAGEKGIAGIVGRYGYYGGLISERPQPPILVIHGENDCSSGRHTPANSSSECASARATRSSTCSYPAATTASISMNRSARMRSASQSNGQS